MTKAEEDQSNSKSNYEQKNDPRIKGIAPRITFVSQPCYQSNLLYSNRARQAIPMLKKGSKKSLQLSMADLKSSRNHEESLATGLNIFTTL